jgi:hypothetical protein
MRLTLRTLLAYLDGILDPNDSQDLGKKIEDSEYAGSLVHRIRDVMRRLRLGSPGLTDRGPGLDPNTVAEYLDNTLATDRVTDFEKVCLDSDIHLAEVASCHQILTLVLGEPAEIDAACRQRIYLLKDHHGAKPPPPPPAGTTSAAPVAAAPPTLDLGVEEELAARKSRLKPTVPEYLRETRKKSKWLPTTVAVVLAICFIGVVLAAFGLFEPDTFGGNLLVSMGLMSESTQLAEKTDVKPTKDGEKGGKKATEEASSTEKKATEPAPGPSSKSDKTPAKASANGQAKTPPTQPVQENPNKSVPEIPPAITSKTPPAVPPEIEPKIPTTTGPVISPLVGPENAVVKEADKATPQKPALEIPPPPEPLGRLMSSDQVVLIFHPTAGWVRANPDQMLMPCNLLAPPTYRAKVAYSAGVSLEILSGTRVELLGGGPKGVPGVRVLYGRVVLRPLAKDKSLRVAFGDRSGVVTFADADSVVAFEAKRVRIPGSNPEGDPPNIAADLYVVTGSASWDETVGGKRGPPTQLLPLQRMNFYAQTTYPPATVKNLPAWITGEPTDSFSDRRASPVIAQALQSDGPVKVGLLELATSRPQKEVKWLSLRCLGYIGQFHDMIMALNDPLRKLEWPAWPDYIEELRSAVDRDPETAAAVRMAIEKQYPQQAAEMYRMLWGYTDKDLQAGEDSKLVRALDDNDVLAVRVLGIWNLKNITGLGNQYYQPEQPAAKRQQYMRRWKERRDKNEIRFRASEEAVPAAQPVAPPEPAEDTMPLLPPNKGAS